MAQDLEKILATVIWEKGDFASGLAELNVEPGMTVEWGITDYGDLVPPDVYHQRKKEGLVTKIIYHEKDGWTVFIQGERKGFPAHYVQATGLSNTLPDIRANEVYEIHVVNPSTIRTKLRFWSKKENIEPKTKAIKARVITQSAIASDALVYLTDFQRQRLFVVSSCDLQKRPRKEEEFFPSRYVPTSTAMVGESAGVSPRAPEPRRRVPRRSTPTDQSVPHQFSSPADIAAELSKYVLYQEQAVRSLSVAAYDHLARPAGVKKSNVLIIGSTGTGKTELARTVAELLGVPFSEAKLAGLSSTGYKGTNLATIFEGLYQQRGNKGIGRAVLFLDEMDKLAEGVSESSGFGPILQNELIGWVESAIVKVPLDAQTHFEVDTTNKLFIGAGAFVGLDEIIAKRVGKGARGIGFTAEPKGTKEDSDKLKHIEELYQQLIPDDLVRFGLKPELVGRFPVLTYTRPLTRGALVDIMKNGAKSAFNQQVLLLKQGYDLSVSVDEKVYGMVADAALNLGTGARGLEAISNKLFEGIKFDIKTLTQGKTALFITPEIAYERLKHLLTEKYRF